MGYRLGVGAHKPGSPRARPARTTFSRCVITQKFLGQPFATAHPTPALTVLGRVYVFPNTIFGLPKKLSDSQGLQNDSSLPVAASFVNSEQFTKYFTRNDTEYQAKSCSTLPRMTGATSSATRSICLQSLPVSTATTCRSNAGWHPHFRVQSSISIARKNSGITSSCSRTPRSSLPTYKRSWISERHSPQSLIRRSSCP